MLNLTRTIRGVLVGSVAVVVSIFIILFVGLMVNAYGFATGARGMPEMFTTYGYLSIEVTFMILIMYGMYEVVRIGFGGKTDDEMQLD